MLVLYIYFLYIETHSVYTKEVRSIRSVLKSKYVSLGVGDRYRCNFAEEEEKGTNVNKEETEKTKVK
jgi:hypothetical protein